MNQKGICEECKKEYEYEYNPKFPRKYCHECSAKKKAEFAGTNVNSENVTPEVEKVSDKWVKEFERQQKKDTGYHLTIEQCRSNALASAIEYCKFGKGEELNTEYLLTRAKQFEQYILTGE